MYDNLKARIRTDVTEHFNVEKRVREGDPLSPLLFNSLLEEIFRNPKWDNKGINIRRPVPLSAAKLGLVKSKLLIKGRTKFEHF